VQPIDGGTALPLSFKIGLALIQVFEAIMSLAKDLQI
jgi:hypothetical protein